MGLYSKYIFPRILDRIMSADCFRKRRKEVLSEVSGKILEIGFGTGLNIAEYPESVNEITTVDVNPGMNGLAKRRVAASGIKVNHQVISAEKMPLEDCSFDTVVSTWTLCSIPDVEGALNEIRRVLKPGGKFIFVEHGLSDSESVRKWQHRLTPFWKIIGDGCHLNRDMKKIVAGAGFELTKCKEYRVGSLSRFAGYFYEGVGVKR